MRQIPSGLFAITATGEFGRVKGFDMIGERESPQDRSPQTWAFGNDYDRAADRAPDSSMVLGTTFGGHGHSLLQGLCLA